MFFQRDRPTNEWDSWKIKQECLFYRVSILLFEFFSPGIADKISQMPIVLIPVHFDRDPIDHIPSCQRSVVIRTFITSDFMTGVPATPGKQIPIEVRISLYREPPKQA